MKKSKIISLFAALFICASLTSCNNEYKNQESYKIYQKAVEEGEFTGTYQEWLDSIKGEKGDTGEDGRSVTSITLTSSEGNIDTYTITYSDGTTSIFKVTNGQDGKQGIQGEKGEDGHTPSITIGGNGNWFIDGVDSGVKAQGDKGEQGEPGKDGRSITSISLTDSNENIDTYTITYSDGTTSTFKVTNGQDGKQGEQGIQGIQGEKGEDGHTPVIGIGPNGTWIIDGVDSGISATGPKGENGKDGRSIISISLTSSEGNVDTYTILYSDNTSSTFKVTNGEDGKQGEQGIQGIQGEKGEDGHTPIITIGENGNWYVDGVDSGFLAKGEQGESAYEIYIKYHPEYEGDEEQWIDDLVNGRLKDKEEGTDGLVYYPLMDNTYAVGGGTTMYLEEIVIPKTYNGKEVSTISLKAFENFANLKKITIPNTITKIDSLAFSGCSSLKYVSVGNNIQKINKDSFSLPTLVLTNLDSFNENWDLPTNQVLLKNEYTLVNDELTIIPTYSLEEIQNVEPSEERIIVEGTVIKDGGTITIADDNLEHTCLINLPFNLIGSYSINDRIVVVGNFRKHSNLGIYFSTTNVIKIGTGNYDGKPVSTTVDNINNHPRNLLVSLEGTLKVNETINEYGSIYTYSLFDSNTSSLADIQFDYSNIDEALIQNAIGNKVLIEGYICLTDYSYPNNFVEVISLEIIEQDNSYLSLPSEILNKEDGETVALKGTIVSLYESTDGIFFVLASKEEDYVSKVIVDYIPSDGVHEPYNELTYKLNDVIFVEGNVYQGEDGLKHISKTAAIKLGEDDAYCYPLDQVKLLPIDYQVNVKGVVAEINQEWNGTSMNVTIIDENGNDLFIYRLKTEVNLKDEIIITNGVKNIYGGKSQLSCNNETSVTILSSDNPLPTFTVEIPIFSNGAVVATKTTNITYGEEITLNIYASEGYILGDITCNGEQLEFISTQTQSITITVTSNIIINASFIQA